MTQVKPADLLAAGNGAAAKVSAGFGVDHGGDMLLGHQVGEELLAALRLLPASAVQRKPAGECRTP